MPPKDSLLPFLRESLRRTKLKEKSIVVIASKIVAIGQGRCAKLDDVKEKDDLIKKEADWYLERDSVPGRLIMLTIKNNLLIATAGIDESNGNGYFILWPEKPFEAAKEIQRFLKKEYSLKKVGVIIADSHSIPCRRGIIGACLSYFGFFPLKDYRGKKDIFGREMKFSQANIADSLAAAAVIAMGEGKEQTPLAVIEGMDFVSFKPGNPLKSEPLAIAPKEDLYFPFIHNIKWKKGGSRPV